MWSVHIKVASIVFADVHPEVCLPGSCQASRPPCPGSSPRSSGDAYGYGWSGVWIRMLLSIVAHLQGSWQQERGETTWPQLVHQQSYTHAFPQEMFGEYLKDRRTPGEPDSYSNKPEHHAQKARVKHPVLRPDQDPLEHTPILRLVGVLLWVSLRTRPDISWAVARITRLASSDESRARVCVKHVAQYLKWTLHFAFFYEPVTDRKWHCYTDAKLVTRGRLQSSSCCYLL